MDPSSSSSSHVGRAYNVGHVRPQSQVVPKHVGPIKDLSDSRVSFARQSRSNTSHFNPLNLGPRFESALAKVSSGQLMAEVPPLEVKPVPLLRIMQARMQTTKHTPIPLTSAKFNTIQPGFSLFKKTPPPHSQIEANIQVPEAWQKNRDWVVNLGMINHVLGKLPKDSPLAPVLIGRALNYQRKFAAIPQPIAPEDGGGLKVTSSPFQKLANYHRGGTPFNEALLAYRLQLGQQINCPSASLEPVSDPRVMEHIYHRYEPLAFDTNTPDLEERVQNFIHKIATNSNSDMPLIDISSFTKNLESGPNLGDDIRQRHDQIRDYLDIFIQRYVDQHPNGGDPAEQLQELKTKLDQVKVFSLLQFDSQSVVYSDSLHAQNSPDDIKAGTFQKLVEHDGFTPGPNQLFESLGTLTNLETAVRIMTHATDRIFQQVPDLSAMDMQLGQAAFPTYDSPQQFLDSASIVGFKQLASEVHAPPYQTILTQGTMDLLEGLMNPQLIKVLQAQKIPPEFMTFTYHRIASAMEKATLNKNNFSEFFEQTQLIHEEIATLLAVTQPYSLADSQHILHREIANVVPERFFSENIAAFSSFKNSGMRGLSDTVTALSWAKGGDQFARLNVVVQKDAYYESLQEVLKQNPLHSVETLNTDRISESLGDDFSDFPPEFKLDLFVCEFHHNISTSRKEYFAEDLSHQVDKMFENNMVAERFTIAIDTTISHTNSKEIQDFLTRQKDRIESGALNVVLYRSGQKFDMMGMDHFNGGVLHTIHNPKAWSSFGERLAPTEEHLATLNLQGLTHYENYGHEAIEAYRGAIIERTQQFVDPFVAKPVKEDNLLYGRFWGSDDADIRQHWHQFTDGVTEPDKEGITPEQHLQNKFNGVLKIVPNYDEHPVFIDFKCPLFNPDLPEDNQLSGEFLNMIRTHMLQTASRNNWPMTERPSFGFPHSNITGIGNEKLRLTLGLESEETHQAYRVHLDKINQALMETIVNNPTLKGDAIIQKMREALNALH